ncbi:hypothetical protein [Streptosporangium pseudovulgare]|nr:hypothetical protein [Streptosporangium pseudovulgare]
MIRTPNSSYDLRLGFQVVLCPEMGTHGLVQFGDGHALAFG